MSTQEQQPQQEQENKAKEGKKFSANHKRLIAILNGEDLLKSSRLGGDDLSKAMEELAKEEKEKIAKQVKDEVKELIQNYITFQKFVEEKRKEMERAITEKQKEFNKKASEIFNKIEGLDGLVKSYERALLDASTESEEETQKEE